MCEFGRSRLGLIFILTGLSLPIAIGFSQEISGESEYERVPAKPGEYCTICNVPLDPAQDVALIVRGRRVPLNHAMVDSFLRTQEKYFAQKQPRGALFQEEMQSASGVSLGGISLGWFLFGSYVLLALICGGLSGYAAVGKGLPPIRHFFIGFGFSVIGYIYVLTRSSQVKAGEIPEGLVKVPVTNAPVTCPKCGNANHPSARHCSMCGTDLQPRYESEVARTFRNSVERKA
jgi:hypothetical protein